MLRRSVVFGWVVTIACSAACASDPKSPNDPTQLAAGTVALPTVSAGSGATAATPAAGGTATSGAGGYVSVGDWHGYAFTSASGMGSTIMPMNFDMRAAGAPLCASGAVGAAADYSGTALIGVNLNQPMGMGSPMTIMPMKAGLYVQVKNPGVSTLRVQIQGPNGAMDANDRWCAPITGTSAFVPWAKFNSKCWDNQGTGYANQPIVAAMVLVPGGMTDPVKFDYCIEMLMAADAAPSGTATGAAGMSASIGTLGTVGSMIGAGTNSGSGTLTDKYGAAMVMRDGRNYVVQNNVWGDSAAQTLMYNGTTFEVTQQTGSNMASGPSAQGPVSYPSTFIGSNYNRTTAGSNLPKQVSALTSVKTGWSHNAGSVDGTYNAAYDVWFSTGAGGDAQAPSGGYLMVWYSKPNGAQPIGSTDGQPVMIPGVSGTWEVWLGQNSGRPCISYVRTEATTSLEFDLKAFIQHATMRPGAIQSSWYLTNVFAGFEIWNGGMGLKTSSFYAIVE